MSLEVYDLRVEHRKNPTGIDSQEPRFSWKLKSSKQNVKQETYRIQVAGDECFEHVIWDSCVIESDISQNVRYAGEELKSLQKLYWKVKVEAAGDSAESEMADFKMAMLSEDEWQADWIDVSMPDEDIEKMQPASNLRKEFSVKKGLRQAQICQTAHGLYEFWINGALGTDEVFKPGFTSYYHRLQYQIYDITNLLAEGRNAWTVTVADGWWRGMCGGLYRNTFGYTLQFLGQIILDYEDGSREIIGTDESFKWAQCGLRMSDMKFGEIFDAAMEPENWKKPGFDDSSWMQVRKAEGEHLEKSILISQTGLASKEKEHFKPVIFTDTQGDTVLDFGQNLVGYVDMKFKNLKRGQKVTITHTEGLKEGAFYLGNVCTALQDNTHYQQIDYIARGDTEESYKSSFSISGFRYVKVEGVDFEKNQPEFEAIAVYSDMEQTGDFICSNDLINQLVKNSRWSQKGNFFDVPTDCPTRERSPWTGDAQVYAKTASRFMDVYAFFEKWLKDLKTEQYRNGMVANSVPATTSMHFAAEVERLIRENKCGFIIPGIAGPDGKPGMFDGSSGWGDAATIVPFMMYLCYGDIQVLENQYESSKKWVDYMLTSAKDENPDRLDRPEYHTFCDGVRDADYIFDTKFHFGEWLEPLSEESGDPANQDMSSATKPNDAIVATAYMYYSSTLAAQMAEILGKEEDKVYYEEKAKQIKRVYNKYYIQEDGTIIENKQASYVRVLQFGLCNEENKRKVADKLIQAVRDNDMCLNTGFLSTPFLLYQLVENGYTEEAYQVLEQTKNPGWLHAVTLGATTILEEWAGLDNHINSYNHYSYGAVCDFLFGVTCGIQPLLKTPGYKHFEIKPIPGGTLTFARSEFDSPYGMIRSEWRKTENGYKFNFEIPVNTTASVKLPDGTSHEIGSGLYSYEI